MFFDQTDPSPASWPKKANFKGTRCSGEAVLGPLQIWIHPSSEMQLSRYRHGNAIIVAAFMAIARFWPHKCRFSFSEVAISMAISWKSHKYIKGVIYVVHCF